jgi:hypothetical protein
VKRVVALSRSPSYSPNQHRANDAAILNAVTGLLAAEGWTVVPRSERDLERDGLPDADLYLNMCQGPAAASWLVERADRLRAPILNHPRGVLNCHRANLVRLINAARLPFPATVLSVADPAAVPAALDALGPHAGLVWVKRGDVHAEVTEDVVAAEASELAGVVHQFAARGVRTIALQANVPGPIVKFYGVQGSGFFHWYVAQPVPGVVVEVDEARLRTLAFAAATALGLEVFGGDAAIEGADRPVLIDLNDWPSFAPVREAAAQAIADRAIQLYSNGLLSCSKSKLTA